MALITPIDALREHVPQTVQVRVFNALAWAGVESVEELAGADERALIQLNRQGAARGKMGKKSASALAEAVRVVMAQKEKHICSFCGKSQKQVGKLIAAEDACICTECVDICVDLLGWRVIKVHK